MWTFRKCPTVEIISHKKIKVNTFSSFLMKINQISPQETKFTEVLEAIAVKPKILYFNGKLPENMVKTVGIVGARKCTPYGEKVAYEAAFELAKAGVVIVSGLAYGVDSVASRAALDAGGVTVAVLGTPIDEIYPREHIRLAEEIVQNGGAIISEYGPGEKLDYKLSFLYRNRLIAGLSQTVLITEAAERSGTLNTAMHTLDQGKELFVAPGDITRITSVGCNRLIAQGARVYTRPSDILEELYPGGLPGEECSSNIPVFSGSPTEKAIAGKISEGILGGERIIEELGISAAEFAQSITMLEIKGVVRPLGMNNWMLR